jgi:hypothetical protein
MSRKDDEKFEDEDQFQCQLCGETFDSQQELESHGAQTHEGDEDYSEQP